MENMTSETKDEKKAAWEQEEKIQWHPAFSSSMEIELDKYRGCLSFISEYELNKKPLRIDVLIIKKEKGVKIEKNIGQIFREYNIVEYKSPKDYLSINDFYKVYAYALLYKTLETKESKIDLEQITLTYVTSHYPRQLLKELSDKRSFVARKQDDGIYYLEGDYIPIQLLVTNELSAEKNMWLSALTNDLSDKKMTEKILSQYQEHVQEEKYQSYLDAVMKANLKIFMEVLEMSNLEESLIDLMKKKGLDKKFEQAGIEKGIEKGIERGREEGKIVGTIETMIKLKCDKDTILKAVTSDYEMTECEANKLIDEIQEQLNKAS